MMSSRVRNRLGRILLMVPLVLREGGVSIEELCQSLDASIDEIVSDLDVLFMCGLPDYGPGDLIDKQIVDGRVYIHMADYFDRPLTITRDEAIALLVSGRALVEGGVFEQDSPVVCALDKIEQAIPAREWQEILDIVERIDIELCAYPGKWWKTIEEAMERSVVLEMEYYSFSRGDVSKREVEPLSLVTSFGHWYLLAWCHEADDRRLFRLDRIKSLGITDKRRTTDTGGELEVPPQVGEYKPGRKAHHVRLKFFGREGRRLLEEWPAARLTENEDGTLTIELRTMNLSWLSRYLIRYGDRVKVESPKKLARSVRQTAQGILEVYR